jgi:hypothetical protein
LNYLEFGINLRRLFPFEKEALILMENATRDRYLRKKKSLGIFWIFPLFFKEILCLSFLISNFLISLFPKMKNDIK